jgi:hypothetical protein
MIVSHHHRGVQVDLLAHRKMQGTSIWHRDEVANSLNLEDDVGTRYVRY